LNKLLSNEIRQYRPHERRLKSLKKPSPQLTPIPIFAPYFPLVYNSFLEGLDCVWKLTVKNDMQKDLRWLNSQEDLLLENQT